MKELPKVREYSRDEYESRREKRKTRASKAAVIKYAIPKKRNRAKHKYRYCVSLSPATAFFFREKYGGESGSLSFGIETAVKILQTIDKERA